LADSKEFDTMSTELESRLDDLFGEDNGALPDFGDNEPAAHYPLAELKNLILSIDWEITDAALEELLQQLRDLKLTYKHDKIVLAFLQILNSLGIYIKTNRGRSHPKTFKILNAVFSSLDKIVLTPDMAETVKKKMLLVEMKRYKELRTQISRRKTAVRPKAEAISTEAAAAEITAEAEQQPVTATESSEQTSETDMAASPAADQGQKPDKAVVDPASIETLADAVEEIKKYIHDQISVLTKEINALRKLDTP